MTARNPVEVVRDPPPEPGRGAPVAVQIVFALLGVGIALFVLHMLEPVLGAFVLGAVTAFVIGPWVESLARRGVPRGLAILVIFVGLAIVAVGIVMLVIPLLTGEVGRLEAQAPSMAAAIQAEITSLRGGPVQFGGSKLDLTGLVEQATTRAPEFLLGQFGNALSLGLAALTTAFQIVLMLIVAFLLALDQGVLQRLSRRTVPVAYRPDFDHLWAVVTNMLHRYLRGQLAIAIIMGIACGVADWALGLQFALALGLLAGLTAVVPYLGPFLGAAPAILVALSQSVGQALWAAAAYFVISNLILNFVYPKLVGDAVNVPPLVVIVALLAGFSFGGILGMFVAVPLAATLKILFDYLEPRIHGTLPAAGMQP